jgi:hypothetical protein
VVGRFEVLTTRVLGARSSQEGVEGNMELRQEDAESVPDDSPMTVEGDIGMELLERRSKNSHWSVCCIAKCCAPTECSGREMR